MAQLADMLAQVRASEIAQAEAEIASCFPPPPQMSPEAQQKLIPFLQWCEQRKVKSLPALPTSVAAFAQFQQDRGVPRQAIADILSAIEDWHNSASVGNPIATPVVRTVTGASTIEAPRSWRTEEKLSFHELPVEIQLVVARREANRERVMRQAQNEAGDLRQALKRLQATAASTQVADTTEKVQRNG
jgi:hypothetical protein